MIGEVLSERYRIDEEIGQGGMGTVYRGYDTTLEREVAIKVLSKAGLGTEGRGELLSEAQTAAKLNHPNIITVHDVGENRSTPFIVMEYVEGRSLHENRPGSLDETLEVMRQVCAGLEHAHSQGIIHRDLKPENVVFTEGGTAKLMDFGLARSVASRYTTEGTVAGTVFYLAPEQVLGQEIDQRTDLYSLGVMLYELTTGELPFVDADPIAIISQHLHAPVVPPQAKNDEISSVLNDLILGLMSKDPRDRPVSVKEVREVLESPEIKQKDIGAVEELTLLDRIVRGRMVGRDRELNQARQLWKNAASGQGQLLLISGEPGIGKTRLTREIATQAEVSGGQVLVGECRAEGNSPYAPFAQITRRALRSDGFMLPKPVMADLLLLSPELRLDHPDVEMNPKLDPEAEQRRLFENVVRFCDTLSHRGPLLLILEDIHWADSSSLRMLEHLARRTRGQRVMLLGTYREVELDEALPLHEMLLELSRRRLGRRVKLERLNKQGTGDMLGIIFDTQITPDFLEGIYKETEGNPFFIEEVSKALVENGQVWYEAGDWQRAPNMEDVSIPQGIKVAIQSRLSKLSGETQEILLTAAVIGREFEYDTLVEVTKKEEEQLISCLEEAIRKQLIEEVKGGGGEQFAFTHALIPGTFREGLSGLRRIRLHRQVAGAIERLYPDDFERLAYHWGEAGDEEKGLAFTIKAAERAKEAYANEEAVRLYSEALSLIPEDHLIRFDLLAGRAAVYDVLAEREKQLVDVEAMLALAEKEGDEIRQADALLALAQFYHETESDKVREPGNKALEIARRLDDRAREGRILWVMGENELVNVNNYEALKYLEESADLLEEAGLTRELIECLTSTSIILGRIGRTAESLELAHKTVEMSKEAGDKQMEALSTRRLAIAYYSQSRYAEALPIAEMALALFREVGDIIGEFHARNVLGINKEHLGRLEEAENDYLELLKTAETIGHDTGIVFMVTNLAELYFWYMDDPEKSLELVNDYLEGYQGENDYLIMNLTGWKAYVFYCLGRLKQAYELSHSILQKYKNILDQENVMLWESFMGFLSAEMGDFKLAHQHIEKALGWYAQNEGPFEIIVHNIAQAAVVEGERSSLIEGLEITKKGVRYAKERQLTSYLGVVLYLEACIHLALLDDDSSHAEAALECTEGALKALEVESTIIRPEQYLFVHSRALRINEHEAQADDYLKQAYEHMKMVAGNIKDGDLRHSYLENVRDHRGLTAKYGERFGV